ncbi:hypothetical protein PHMEG_00039951, partial [Phytophthora megakarya]
RSYSSPSLRSSPSPSLGSSPSRQSTASPGSLRQKSFGRQLARVPAFVSAVASASVPVEAELENSSSLTVSLEDTDNFHDESTRALAPAEHNVGYDQENTDLRTEVEILRQQLQDLHNASSKLISLTCQSDQNDEVWQRENARLKGQLTAANAREEAQQDQLRICVDQLALCRQELRELQDQLKTEEHRHVPVEHRHVPVEHAGSSGLGRERDLLKLIAQLVTSPPKAIGSMGSLNKTLFGASQRPPSPTSIRFNSMGPLSPHK